MIDKVKLALRISTSALDSEIQDNIDAALADLGIAGIVNLDTVDPLICRAVVTFCKLNMGDTDDYEHLKKSYDEQKGQLQHATGYTDWGDTDGSK